MKEKKAMPDEKKLVQQFNLGSQDAFCQIYQLYKKDMYGFAISLLHNADDAQDAVHDVFVSFAKTSGKLKLKSSLKSYLLTCIANRARDHWRRSCRSDVVLDDSIPVPKIDYSGEQYVILTEEYKRLTELLLRLTFEQREIVLLHLHHDMTFREIACAQGVSINTIQSRYRYGMERLRQLLKEGRENEKLQTNRRLDSSN